MKISKDHEKNIKNFLISFASATAIILVATFILAVIMHFLEIGKEYSSPLSGVALGAGCFFGGFIHSRLHVKNGLVCGLIISCAIYLIIALVSLIGGSNIFSLNALIHLMIVVLSSAIGGILGVNTGKRVKI